MPTTIRVSGVAPTAINWASSVASATLQRPGTTTRSSLAPGSTLQLSALAWHVLYVPVLTAWSAPLVADPGLEVLVDLTPVPLAPASGNTTGNDTGVDATSIASISYRGYWSWTNGSYVVPFSLPASGDYDMAILLQHDVNRSSKASSESTAPKRCLT